MRITPEQIYDLAGLKVGDKIRMTNSSRIYTILKDVLRGENGLVHPIDLLIINDFEKIEDKIWNINEIKEENRYYYLDEILDIRTEKYDDLIYQNEQIEKSLTFKKEKYAQEYKEKLIEFNENYKKGCE